MLFRLSRVLIIAGACAGGAIACAEPDELSSASLPSDAAPQPGIVVDSIIPIDEAVRRFRAEIDEVTVLSDASLSRDSLVRRFVQAVETSDSTAIRAMALSRAEFAYLYYPFTEYTSKPYEMEPGLLWFIIGQNSEKGITRMLRRYGGKPLRYDGYSCEPEPTVQGENRLWQRCQMTARAIAADGTPLRLFGSILERDGRFKFVSYTNEF